MVLYQIDCTVLLLDEFKGLDFKKEYGHVDALDYAQFFSIRLIILGSLEHHRWYS
jgi:hypothetical protein